MPNGQKRNDPDCTCDVTQGDFHTCPYDEDVNDNPESSCDCCAACTNECAMDI